MTTCDVAIIGAGPYGLSAAAHLRTIKGLEVRAFGEPMSFWERNMPVGMFLRSNWSGTRLGDPNCSLRLEAYQMACGNHLSFPVPINRFVQYGLWYQRQAVPDLDRRKIARVEADGKSVRVVLEDGEVLNSAHVVIAAGIGSVAERSPELRNLPSSLAAHSSKHLDLRRVAADQMLPIRSPLPRA